MRTFTTVCAFLLYFATLSHGYDVCSSGATWRSVNGHIELNGQEFHVKGVNWWGLEDPGIRMLTGLDKASLATYLNFMTTNKFNAIRIPLSVDWVLHPDRAVQSWTVTAEPALQGKTSFQALDYIFSEAQKRGISIMIDFHWFITFTDSQLGLWYSQGPCVLNPENECRQFTEKDVMDAWSTIIGRYKSYSNFMGADFINEAYQTTWGTNINTDWDGYVNRQAADILSRHPDFQGLFWIEGIADAPNPSGCNVQQTPGHWWGGNLELVQCKALTVPANRLVWCPHTYGPLLYAQSYFSAPNYPANMPAIWDAHFGYLAARGQTIVVGEWGGVYTGSTKVFEDSFATYMAGKNIGNFYWALIGRPGEVNTVDGLVTPNGDGTLTITAGKIPMLQTAAPSPTAVTFSASASCSAASSAAAASTSSSSAAASSTSTSSSTTAAASTSTISTTASSAATTSTTGAPATGTTTGTTTCSMSAKQTVSNSWPANGGTVTQYSVTITNLGSQAVSLKFKFVGGAPGDFYSITANSDGSFGLPSWLTTLAAGASFDFGYTTATSVALGISYITPSCGQSTLSGTVASSSSSSSSSATSTTGPKASTSSSTTGAPINPATSAASTTGSSTSSNTCRFSLSQTKTNSWTEGSTAVSQYDVTFINTGVTSLKAIELSASPAGAITQIWNVNVLASGNYGMPSWVNGNLAAGASFTFGYVVRSASSASFAQVSAQC